MKASITTLEPGISHLLLTLALYSLPHPLASAISSEDKRTMFQAFKSVRTDPNRKLSLPLSLSSGIGRDSPSYVRFWQVTTFSSQPESAHSMDKSADQNQIQNTGDVMSHSFGEGYASRSDEEGFGGIYGGNQSFPEADTDKEVIHENHPAYDKTQGSEVKEKEKARHQTNANTN